MMKYWPRIYFWLIGTLATQIDPCKDVFSICDHAFYRMGFYKEKTESCYFDFSIKMTYEDAKSFCKASGTHLLTIFSVEEQFSVSQKFQISNEGRWLALEQQNGAWYWMINGIKSQMVFSNLNGENANRFTRAITQYNNWKPTQENEKHMFVCKGNIKKESTFRDAHFSRLNKEWLDVFPLGEEYWTRNVFSCGNACLGAKCCCGFTFLSAQRKCQLYQRSFFSRGFYSVTCPQNDGDECYVRN